MFIKLSSMIRNIICFLIIFCFSGFLFSQFPSWMPKEFRNKVFCGVEKNVSGEMRNIGTYSCDVEYEMIVAEGGFQVKFNPGVRFGENRWGETIKVKYNTIKVGKTRYGIDYSINLNSTNETDDSPLKPTYELKVLYFHISTYDGSKPTSRDEIRNWIEPSPTHFSCEVLVPYHSDTYFSSDDSHECRKLKSAEDILVEKLEIERKQQKEEKEKKEKEIENKLKDNSLLILIKDHLNQKSTNLALESYNNLNLTASQQEVRGLLETSLIEYYKQNPKEISKSELNEFIRKYNTVFKTVNPGNHTLKIDTDGSIFIDDKIINQKSEIFRMNVGNDLTIPYVTKANFELIQKQEFGGEERFETSTTRKVSKTKRGDYYKVSFFTYSIFSFPVTKTINENIPKNSYNVVQPIIESKFINDNFISKENTVKVIKQGQFKKRIGVAIRRSIVSAFVIVWSSLRIYEMSLIPV